MAWMLMPGQTGPGAVASFLAMWVVMMVATMLPSRGHTGACRLRGVGAGRVGRGGCIPFSDSRRVPIPPRRR